MIVTDAWFPQTNGVVSTLAQTAVWLGRFGHEVRIITPRDFRSIACPTYPEIRLSILPYKKVKRSILGFAPHALHIATEGPLGLSARRFCLEAGMRFTTSYHTQFPQYLRARFPIPLKLSYRALRRFHGAAVRCMVSTASVRRDLACARLREPRDVAPRRGYRDLQALSEKFPRIAPPHRRLCRSRGRREEHRRILEDGLDRKQGRHRRRSGAGAARETISLRHLPRLPFRRRISR